MSIHPTEKVRPRTAAGEPALSVRGAAVCVGGRTLWSGVDLTVGAGEFTAGLGPDGGILPPPADGTSTEVTTAETWTRLYRTPTEVLRTGDGRPVVVGRPEAPARPGAGPGTTP